MDDVFLIWLHGKENLIEFLNFVNGYHPFIEYTWKWSTKRLPYLDVMILVEDGRILTGVYSKPTDTHQYLHYGSCHPTHVKKGIPYGQALRMKRICSTKETYNRRLEMLRGNFEKRGFSKGFVDSQFNKAKEISRAAAYITISGGGGQDLKNFRQELAQIGLPEQTANAFLVVI